MRYELLIVIAAISTLFFTWLSFDDEQMLNTITVKTADTHEHLNPTDNLIEEGVYSLRGNQPYAVRMPGYAFAYLPLRIMFATEQARLLLIILQLTFFTLSVWLSFKWLSEVIQARIALAFVLLFTLFNYLNHIHFKLLPVSLSISVLLTLFYLHHILIRKRKFGIANLLLFGFLATWLFFLRPFLGPLLIIWMLLIISHIPSQKFKAMMVIFIPLLVIEGSWIMRNYLAFDRFIPLQTTFAGGDFEDHYKDEETKGSILALRPFISGFGGDNVWYFPRSEMSWLLSEADDRKAKEVFPEVVFSSGITSEELDEFKQLILHSYQNYDPVTEAEITAKAVDLDTRLKTAHPIYYYVTSRLKTLADLFTSNVTQDWSSVSFAEASLASKIYRLACVALWMIVMPLGALISLFAAFRRLRLHYPLIIWGMIFIFLYLVNFVHFQYFIFAYIAAFLLIAQVVGKNPLVENISDRLRLIR